MKFLNDVFYVKLQLIIELSLEIRRNCYEKFQCLGSRCKIYQKGLLDINFKNKILPDIAETLALLSLYKLCDDILAIRHYILKMFISEVYL